MQEVIDLLGIVFLNKNWNTFDNDLSEKRSPAETSHYALNCEYSVAVLPMSLYSFLCVSFGIFERKIVPFSIFKFKHIK